MTYTGNDKLFIAAIHYHSKTMATPDRGSEEYRHLQQLYPSGSPLDQDRKHRAQTVFKPNQIDKWLAMGVNRSDLQGYDTPSAREPSKRKIMGTLARAGQVGYVESEPERFVHPTHRTYKLLSEHKDEITSYETFKAAVQKAWNKDHSLPDLVDNMTEADYQALYKTGTIQKWLESNSKGVLVEGLQRRFNIERRRAEAIYERLTPDNRQKLMGSLLTGRRVQLRQRLPEAEPEPTPRTVAPAQAMLRQRSRGGHEYSRTKPVRWTELEVQFIRSNRQVALQALLALHNQTFSHRRTLSSLRNKRQRIGR